jgi:hypothetical protein
MASRTARRFGKNLSLAMFFLVALMASGCASVQSTTRPQSKNITVSVDPPTASIQVSTTQKFTAVVSNSTNPGVTWQVNGVTGGDTAHGKIDATGVFTAPAAVPSPPSVTVAAIAHADPTVADVAQVTISTGAPAITLTLAPTTASVQVGKTQSISATVHNDGQNKGVTWTLAGAGCTGAACGTLSAVSSASGEAITYTAPATVPSPATMTLTAKSVADTSKTAVGTITVTATPVPPAIGVTVNPTTAVAQIGKTQSFTATVQNDAQNKGVTWTLTGAGCSGAACGTLSAAASASGAAITYTAPATAPAPAAVTLTAKSVVDTSKTAAASITITVTLPPSVAVTVNPTAATVQVGKTQSISATVQNDSQNKGVTWALTGAGCSGAACGTLSAASSASGAAITYTAPATAPATVTLTVKSVADTSKTAAVTITITLPPAVAISVNPTSATVQTGQTHNISATVQNDSQNKGVTWTLTGAGCLGATCGTLSTASSASGAAITYTAPGAAPNPATVTVTAKSVADTTKTAATTITVTSPSTGTVAVSISPKRAGLTTGQTRTFAATVNGSANTSVAWEVDTVPGGNSSTGTVSSSGVYTPPSAPGTHTVAARSVADSTVSASASVAVTDLGGVYTYHNNLSRDGVNSKEYALNTSNVKSGTFGKRFACSIDAAAYAQPLWVANVAIGGGTHNVLIAATQHDTVYAFDADASPCQTFWTKSLLGSGETWLNNGNVGSNDITPDIGIVGTPVIDPATKTIYVVSKSKNGGSFHQRLHALSLIDGSEKFSGPKDIAFTSGGITFDPLRQNERCGLALVNGVVYIAYASHGDNAVYYGWVLGYSASTLAQTSVFNDDPASSFGGIWMSGGAPAADSNNNLFVITGNGNFDGNSEFGDSFLKLSTGNGLSVSSFFSPSDQVNLKNNDTDLGSGGAAILVDQPSSPIQHLVIGGGKGGTLYVLNRDSLGGNTSNDSGVVQILNFGNSIFATPAFWQNTLYLAPVQGHLQAFAFNATSGKFSGSSQSPETYGFPGATASISSQGSSNGIAWTIEFPNPGAAILHAHDAANVAIELWNSDGTAGDVAGQPVKFTVPTVANGKVYVGTASEIDVYGLSPN